MIAELIIKYPLKLSIGAKNSDIESANDLIKKYVLLTDESISLTGYEEQIIKNRCIELSILWKKEVEKILRDNKNEVVRITVLREKWRYIMKETNISHCQVCGVEFEKGQEVYYVPLDNNIVCQNCSFEHEEKQPRKVVE